MAQTARKQDVKPPRKKGHPRPLWAFRPTLEVQALIDSLNAERTAAINEHLELAVGLKTGLKAEWGEIMKRSIDQSRPPADIIVELAREALKKR